MLCYCCYILVLLQDGRLCCTFDIRCSASSQQSRRAAPKEPQSSQTLLHSTVTTAADIVTTDTSSVSDAIPSETTLGWNVNIVPYVCIVRFYRMIYRFLYIFICIVKYALRYLARMGALKLFCLQYLFVRVSGFARMYNVTRQAKLSKEFI